MRVVGLILLVFIAYLPLIFAKKAEKASISTSNIAREKKDQTKNEKISQQSIKEMLPPSEILRKVSEVKSNRIKTKNPSPKITKHNEETIFGSIRQESMRKLQASRGRNLFSSLFNKRKLKSIFSNILKQTMFEQEVEDINAINKLENVLTRRLIVMPLNESFKINQADAMHQKVQYGDKCSLPSSLGRFIFDNRVEAPWIFEIRPASSPEGSSLFPKKSVQQTSTSNNHEINEINAPYFRSSKVQKAYLSPLDFRSPENYIFIPKWMMNDLNLRPNDLVEIRLVRIRLADLVVFQPVSKSWDDLMKETKDPKTLLEHEINKYSSLTAGTTIYIKINQKEYPIFVKETIAEGGISVHGVRVQDSDIKTDIDRSIVDKLIAFENSPPERSKDEECQGGEETQENQE